MSLRKLKKELKQQLRATPSKQRGRRSLLLLAGLLLLLAVGFGYRSYQRTVPERLLDGALAEESQGQPEAALALYEKLFQRYPDSSLAGEALFRAGRICQLDRNQDRQALVYYLQLERDYPQHRLLTQARQEAAEITKYRLRDCLQAIVIYQRLLDQGGGEGDRLLYEIADCYFRLENYAQARIELETLLARFPDSPLRPEVLYRRASASLLEGQRERAREGLQQLIESFPESPYAMEARFSLAGLLEEEGQLRAALKEYQALRDYPRPTLLQEKIGRLQRRITQKKKAI